MPGSVPPPSVPLIFLAAASLAPAADGGVWHGQQQAVPA